MPNALQASLQAVSDVIDSSALFAASSRILTWCWCSSALRCQRAKIATMPERSTGSPSKVAIANLLGASFAKAIDTGHQKLLQGQNQPQRLAAAFFAIFERFSGDRAADRPYRQPCRLWTGSEPYSGHPPRRL